VKKLHELAQESLTTIGVSTQLQHDEPLVLYEVFRLRYEGARSRRVCTTNRGRRA